MFELDYLTMDIQEVIDLKKQLEEDFKKDTEAIDRVLTLLEKRNASQQSEKDLRPMSLPRPIGDENGSSNNNQIEVYQPQARKIDFADENAENSLNGNGHENKNGNKFGRVRDTGVKGIAKQAVPFLSSDFQRKDLIATMAKHFPEWSDKLTKDAINGALARLLEDGIVKVKVKARGKFPATYTKIESN